jgi:hypothetical protein
MFELKHQNQTRNIKKKLQKQCSNENIKTKLATSKKIAKAMFE